MSNVSSSSPSVDSSSSPSSRPWREVSAVVVNPVSRVWHLWTDPMHTLKWNGASGHCYMTYAESDLREGGKFYSRMEAVDGSAGQDFTGIYTTVIKESKIEYVLGDDRKVKITFTPSEDGKSTRVQEEFQVDDTFPVDIQHKAWQSILDAFKGYVEQNKLEMLRFSEIIEAPPSKVYELMFSEKTYRDWSKAFNPHSQFVGTWEKRSIIRFMGESNGKKGGMVSRIRENLPGKFVSLEHLGVIRGDTELMEGTEAEEWKGSMENYKFVAVGTNSNQTQLEVAMESNEKFQDYFRQTWPKALQLLKELCEKP